MDEYRQANQALWDEWTDIHAESKYYDLESFMAGKSSLKALDIVEVGAVAGKTLLHLQCHFGMDTLSWARLGAQATGVDFSEKAITLARRLNTELGLDAEFVCSDVYELPDNLDGQFDIVYTSEGVLAWLRDLPRWGQVIAHFLKPGGTFYIREIHPFGQIFDDQIETPELRVVYPYFGTGEAHKWETQGTYADWNADVAQPYNYQWTHSLGEVVNALLDAELHLEFLHEYPFSSYQMLAFMEQREDGWWYLPENLPEMPFTFTIKARK